MSIKETEKRRHDLLEALTKKLNESLIAAVLRDEEGEAPMVSALLDELGEGDMEVMGDFFFRQTEEEEGGIQIFTSVLTIAEDIPEERLPALFEAMSYINFNIPAGCFSIDKDHRFFCYELITLMSAGMKDPEVFREMDLAVENAISIVNGYIGILSDVLKGETDAKGVIEFLGGPEDDE